MPKLFFELNLILIIIHASCFVISLSQPSNLISSCLTNHHVTNFTLFPTPQNNNLLLFSLQNLRFSTPKLPKPLAIILPESKDQLVSSLLCSKEASYEIKIRSGGHSYEGISSLSYDGKPFVIIDMMKLDQVVVDLHSETAWVEGGATIGQVYYTIANQSKGVYEFSAGTCPTMGIGGHILGGGFGLLFRKYGLAADNVLDALLVGPEGQVLDRATMGEDVFWAIRGGGGGCFGIVYAWKIKILKVPPKVTTCIVSRNGNYQNMSQLVHKWQDVGPYLNDEYYLSASIGAKDDGNATNNVITSYNVQYLGPKIEAISMIDKSFPELNINEGECNEMSWIEAVLHFSYLGEGSTIIDLNNRYLRNKSYFKGKSDYVTTKIPINALQDAMAIIAKEPKGLIIIDPYGGQMARIPNNSIPFPHRKENLFGIQYMVSWKKEDDINKDRYINWVMEIYNFMTPFVSMNPRGAYVNYIDLDLGGLRYDVNRDSRGEYYRYDAVEEGRVWGEKYFGNNYERLVKAKTIIDPCNFFRYPQGIPPLPNNKQCHSY